MPKGGGAPQAPNPYDVADAQSQANTKAIQESAKVNAVNQYSPYGSTTFQKDANGVPISQTIQLAPGQQQYFDTSTAIRNYLANLAQTTEGGLPTTPFTGPSTGNQDAVTKALYDKSIALLQPSFDQQNNQENVTLGERGIPIGSEIYKNEMDRLAAGQNNARTTAAQNATLAGGQQYTQDLNNALTIRNQPFNELSAYLNGAPQQPTPQFSQQPSYQAQAPNISGLIENNYQNQLAQYNQQQSSMMNGLFGLGSAAIGLISDRRVKKDIRQIGRLDNGLPVYSFRYIGGGPVQLGVMAQDVESVVPEAVIHVGNDKLLMVDYGKIADAVEQARSA